MPPARTQDQPVPPVSDTNDEVAPEHCSGQDCLPPAEDPPRECKGWVEETIEYTLTFFRLPRQHRKHLKSTNMLERLNKEIRRRTYVVRIFPNT
jgi:hypothetical protein